jgi:hypothetical protein
MRNVLFSLSLVAALTAPAKAGTELNGEQSTLAMAIDGALSAADNCPGFRLVDRAIAANVHSAGLTDQQAKGEEWKNAMFLSDLNSKEGYAKDPSGFCKRMWVMLGPKPIFVKYQLLDKN